MRGLNLDFVLLNVVGFALYSCYNLMLFCDKDIQENIVDSVDTIK